MLIAAIILVLAALVRIAPTIDPSLVNFSPVMAIAFCGGVYFRPGWRWALPFGALALSDLYLNHFYAREYGFHWSLAGLGARTACFGLLGAIIFYLVTNTQSWAGDVFYAKTLAGWWQALTIGHPEYPPTLFFFRNTLFGDLLFTGLFAGIMEWLAHRRGAPSLWAETAEPVEEPVGAEVEK